MNIYQAKTKQEKDLEKVSQELQRTRQQLATLLAQQEAQNRKGTPAFSSNRFNEMITGAKRASQTHAGMWEGDEQKSSPTAQLVQKTPKSVKVTCRLKIFL